MLAVALYATICLWSHGGEPTCQEVPLTPGAAGPGFETMDECTRETPITLQRWLDEAGDVFGFTSMQGDGYQISTVHCGDAVPNEDNDD